MCKVDREQGAFVYMFPLACVLICNEIHIDVLKQRTRVLCFVSTYEWLWCLFSFTLPPPPPLPLPLLSLNIFFYTLSSPLPLRFSFLFDFAEYLSPSFVQAPSFFFFYYYYDDSVSIASPVTSIIL